MQIPRYHLTPRLAACTVALAIVAAPHAQAQNVIEDDKLTADSAGVGDAMGAAISASGDAIAAGAVTTPGSVLIFERELGSWVQRPRLTAVDGMDEDLFATSLSLSGDTLLVGAPGDRGVGPFTGSAYVFARTGGSWMQQAKIEAGDPTSSARFGASVAVSGDTAVVGAPGDFVPGAGADAGSFYVFVRTGSSWNQTAKITVNDAVAEGNLGSSVAISGNTIVVGASGDSEAGIGAGAAYVFVGSGASWTEQAKLTASDAESQDVFGGSVAISGDTVVIGAAFDRESGSESGSAYVFDRAGNAWSEQTRLGASDAAAGDRFGQSVSVAEGRIVVGAGPNGPGAAYRFVLQGGGWTEDARLIASDGVDGDLLGQSVTTTAEWTAAGAPGVTAQADGEGAAYVFAEEAPPSVPATSLPGTVVLILALGLLGWWLQARRAAIAGASSRNGPGSRA